MPRPPKILTGPQALWIAAAAAVSWFDEVGRRRGQAALTRFFGGSDDQDDLDPQPVFTPTKE